MFRNFQGVHLLYTPKTLLPMPWDNEATSHNASRPRATSR